MDQNENARNPRDDAADEREIGGKTAEEGKHGGYGDDTPTDADALTRGDGATEAPQEQAISTGND